MYTYKYIPCTCQFVLVEAVAPQHNITKEAPGCWEERRIEENVRGVSTRLSWRFCGEIQHPFAKP